MVSSSFSESKPSFKHSFKPWTNSSVKSASVKNASVNFKIVIFDNKIILYKICKVKVII